MKCLRLLLLASIVALLGGCASDPVPDVAYYRIASLTTASADAPAAKRFVIPLVVDALVADGVYNDQSILYATKPEGSIKAYHYQLWDESPGTMLQRRLIDTLRARGAAKLVTDRLPPAIDSLRVSGRIERFERVKTASGWIARVRLELRVERGVQHEPMLLSDYAADVPANGESIQATVRAFAAAIDQSYAAFWSELEQLPD